MFSSRRAYSSRTSCSRGVNVWPGPFPARTLGGGSPEGAVDMVRVGGGGVLGDDLRFVEPQCVHG